MSDDRSSGVGDLQHARPTFVGTPVQRLEDPRFLTGRGRYVDDLRPPGMCHVAFRRSDHAHARITAIDVSEALAMPGVIAVFRAEDLPDTLRPIRARSRSKSYQDTDLPILARDKVRYVGEPIVAVLAESRYLAEDAVEAVEIAFDPLPTVIDPQSAVADDAPLLHDDASSNVILARTFARGDVDAASQQASIRVREQFRFHRKSPSAIENRCYLAEFDTGRNALTLHSTTQIPGILRDLMDDLFDDPDMAIRVVAPDVGGSFGGKASLYPEEMLVCVLSRTLQRPVKWTSDRMEDLATTTQGFDQIVDAELFLDSAGDILAATAEVIGDVGAYSIYPWTAALEPVQVISFIPGPYRIPTYRGSVRAVCTSKAPMGPYRGVGRPTSTFVMERLMDKAAALLQIDPLDLRRKNLVRDDEFPYKAASGLVWDKTSFTACLEAAADGIDYPALRQWQVAERAKGRWVGIGIASYAELTGIGSRIAVGPGMPINTGTETATVKLDSSGRITAAFGIAGHGQSLETTLAQVVADALGARVEDVRVKHGDSDLVSHGTGTYASRSAVLGGGAGTLAATEVREKLVRCAAHIFQCAAGEIEVQNSEIMVPGTNHRMSFRELSRTVYSQMGSLPLDLRSEIGDLSSTKSYDPFLGTTSPATHIAAVAVDPDTYEVTVERYLVAEDCGRVINPLVVDGQVHGGVAQGIGAALFEEVVYDEDGQLLTASFVDYVVPSAAEIPSMEVLHLEPELPDTLGGFRGMGEGGTIGAPAAIASALSDALSHLDVEINQLPATPETPLPAHRTIEHQQHRGVT